MKQNKLNQIISAVVALILGIMVGQNLDRIKELVKVNQLLPSSGCQYNGKNYKTGDAFPSTDGCNSCGCSDGQVACTLMACERPSNE